MEQPSFARTGGDDDHLFLMDDAFLLLKEDTHQQQQQQLSAHNNNHLLGVNASSTNMDGFDHVDSLLMGFDLDAPLDHASFESNNAAPLPLSTMDAMFDGSASPTTTDDMSGSEMSSPPPSFDVSPASSPVRLAPAPARNALAAHSSSTSPVAPRMAPALASAMSAFANASALPYALPVAYFPPPQQQVVALNVNQKRPFPSDVLPTPTASASTAATDASDAKKSKREIRQMKNRESANKSRLRRKAQMSELADEVNELTKKQHELENTIAALRAENKSLHDQNAFLRSLVAKPVDSSTDVLALQQSLSGTSDLHASSLSAMENGQELDFAPQKKHKTSRATTFSAASLSLCASVFGVTIFSDYSGDAAESSHIRRPGRVLHSLPATIDAGFTPVPSASYLDFFYDTFASSWTYVSSSELAFGVFLNVLSFVVIMGLYHAWQSSFTLSPSRVQRWATASCASASESASTRPVRAVESKRRSLSWQAIRSRDRDSSGDASDSSRDTSRLARALL